MMRVLVTGAKGQLGTDVVSALQRCGMEPIASDADELDIVQKEAVERYFLIHKPDAVIHCAAYTAVDKAESDADICAKINIDGSRNVAHAAESVGAKMIYISSDYVYSGDGDQPQVEDAAVTPRNVYGRTKLAGEEAARECSRLFVVRTSWVYGLHGHNFVKTILHASQTHDTLRVVCDQVGSPTFTEDLAAFLCDLVQSEKYGTYNVSGEGFCSWHTFAQTILTYAGQKSCVIPVSTDEYPCAAVRPLNSRLHKQKLRDAGFAPLPYWKDALARFMHQYVSE